MSKRSRQKRQNKKAARAQGWKDWWERWNGGGHTHTKPVKRAREVGQAGCPRCQGTGLHVEGNIVGLCGMCHGRRKIQLDICPNCGRPAAWLRGGIAYCGGKRCRVALMPKAREVFNSQRSSPKGGVVNRTREEYEKIYSTDDNDDMAYGGWGCKSYMC